MIGSLQLSPNNTTDHTRQSDPRRSRQEIIIFYSELKMRSVGVLCMFSLLAGSLSRPQSEGNHQMDVEARMELRDIENVKPHTLIFSRQDG